MTGYAIDGTLADGAQPGSSSSAETKPAEATVHPQMSDVRLDGPGVLQNDDQVMDVDFGQNRVRETRRGVIKADAHIFEEDDDEEILSRAVPDQRFAQDNIQQDAVEVEDQDELENTTRDVNLAGNVILDQGDDKDVLDEDVVDTINEYFVQKDAQNAIQHDDYQKHQYDNQNVSEVDNDQYEPWEETKFDDDQNEEVVLLDAATGDSAQESAQDKGHDMFDFGSQDTDHPLGFEENSQGVVKDADCNMNIQDGPKKQAGPNNQAHTSTQPQNTPVEPTPAGHCRDYRIDNDDELRAGNLARGLPMVCGPQGRACMRLDHIAFRAMYDMGVPRYFYREAFYFIRLVLDMNRGEMISWARKSLRLTLGHNDSESRMWQDVIMNVWDGLDEEE